MNAKGHVIHGPHIAHRCAAQQATFHGKMLSEASDFQERFGHAHALAANNAHDAHPAWQTPGAALPDCTSPAPQGSADETDTPGEAGPDPVAPQEYLVDGRDSHPAAGSTATGPWCMGGSGGSAPAAAAHTPPPSAVKHRNLITHVPHQTDVVGHKDDGHARRPLQFLQEV